MIMVAIKAPLENRWDAVAKLIGCEPTSKIHTFDDTQEMSDFIHEHADEYFDKDLSLIGTWIENGWTIIWSVDGYEWLEEPTLGKLHKLFKTDVWIFNVQLNTTPQGKEISQYLFSFAGAKQQRKFSCLNGRIIDDLGDKQEAEEDLDLSGDFSEDDMDLLMENLGITYAADDDIFKVMVFKEKKK